MTELTIEPLAGSLGAEIGGIDLRDELSEETVAAIRSAWLEHLVVFFRDQDLAADDFVRFARRFGEPAEYPFVPGLTEHPEIIAVTKLPHETVNFGGLLGHAPVMRLHAASSEKFVARRGRIPAPLQGLNN